MAHALAQWRIELVTFILSPIILYLIYRTGRFAKKLVQFVFEWLLWLLGRHIIKSLASRMSMRFYCRNQIKSNRFKSLNVPGHRALSLSVDRVFVPLTIEYTDKEQSELTGNLDLLQGNRRMLVVGDPGSGKSSLVKHLFRESCRAGERNPTKSRLPVHLELKTLGDPGTLDQEQAAAWLLAELRNQVVTVQGYNMGQLFDSCLTTVGIMLFLDGLDEVSGDHYPRAAAALRGLSKLLSAKSDENSIIITMRIQYYHEVQYQLLDDYPDVAYIKRFSPNEIYTFLTKWPFKANPERNITRIYADLTDRPTLRTMCSNPLVLAMYVANDQSAGEGEVPESRTDFYRSVVDELLALRRRRQEVVRAPSRALREQREEILGELAFDNLVDSGQHANSLDWSSGLEVAGRVWGVDGVDVERRFRALASETGIIAEERHAETFQFIHRTFCEFLAAIECSSNPDRWERLLDTHKSLSRSKERDLRTRLVEVIPFALALMIKPERPHALAQVAVLGDREVLGRCFLETQLYDSREWGKYVSNESRYLSAKGRRQRDDAWLRRLHLFNVVLRDAGTWTREVAGREPDSDLNSLFSRIVGSDAAALKEVFGLYASEDAPAAFRLAESVGVDMLTDYGETLIQSCQEPPFLALAMERAVEGSTHQTSWRLLLAESGLRYRNVSHALTHADAPEGLRRTGANNAGARASRLAAVVRTGSFYQMCLISAFSRGEREMRSEFRVISTLQSTRFVGLRALKAAPIVAFSMQLLSLVAVWWCLIWWNDTTFTSDHSQVPSILLLGVLGVVLYFSAFIVLFCGSYNRTLIRELCNYDRFVADTDPDKARKRPESLRSSRVSASKLGRFCCGPFVRSEQFALFSISLIRGGVELGGRGKGDGGLSTALLPPKKVRSWSENGKTIDHRRADPVG